MEKKEIKRFDPSWEGKPLFIMFTDEDGASYPVGFFDNPISALPAVNAILSKYVGRKTSDEDSELKAIEATAEDITPHADTIGYDFNAEWYIETEDGDEGYISMRGMDGFGNGWKRPGRYFAWFTDEYNNRFDEGFYITLDDVAELANNYVENGEDGDGNPLPQIKGSDLVFSGDGPNGWPEVVYTYDEECGEQFLTVIDMGE